MTMTPMTVLFVDDEPQITSALKRALHKEPLRVLQAHSGAEALEILAHEPVDVIVSDEVMPGMTGSELLAQVRELYPEMVRIILTGHASLEATVRAINEGRIYRYLFKPCSERELLEVISTALEEKRNRDLHNALILQAGKIASWEWRVGNQSLRCSENMGAFLNRPAESVLSRLSDLCDTLHPDDGVALRMALENSMHLGQGFDLDHRISVNGIERWISQTVDVLQDQDGRTVRMIGVLKDITDKKRDEDSLRQSLENLSTALRSMVHALGVTTEKRDPYTAGHQERVANLAQAIAWEMGLEEEQLQGVHTAGLLHDIGKISVPAEMLSKPSLLSEFEMAIIKTHPTVGHEILKEIPFPWPIAQMVLQHHERLDGSGYPAGLSGTDILLEARILAVADVVEAMASHRPYRASLGLDMALGEIREKSGKLYDPDVVRACLNISPRLTEILNSLKGTRP